MIASVDQCNSSTISIQTSGSTQVPVSAPNGTVITIGLVLLGDNNVVPTPELTGLSKDSADKMGLSAAELDAFNHNLNKINLAFASSVNQMVAQAHAGASASAVQAATNTMWEQEVKPQLSAAAYSAARKVAAAYSQILPQFQGK